MLLKTKLLILIVALSLFLLDLAKAEVYIGMTPWGPGPRVNLTQTIDEFFADGGTVYIWLNYTCTGTTNCTTLTVRGNFTGIGGSVNRQAVFKGGVAAVAYYEINETVNLSAIPNGLIGIEGGDIIINATSTDGNSTIDVTGVALVNMTTIPSCPPPNEPLPSQVPWNGSMKLVNSCNLTCPVQDPIYQINDTHVDLCPPTFGGGTTNFTKVAELGNFSAVNLVIDVPGKAKINFTTPIDMSNRTKAGMIMRFAMENLMSGGRVGINESEWNGIDKPNLNLSAIVTLYNVTGFLPLTNGDYSIAYGSYSGFETPSNLQLCPPSRCPSFSFDGENLTFTVTSWSSYIVGGVEYNLLFSNLTATETVVNQGVNATYLINITNMGNNTNDIFYNISVQGFGYINTTQIKFNSTLPKSVVIQLNVSNSTEGLYLSNITAVLSDNSSIIFNSYDDGLNRNIRTISDNTPPTLAVYDYTNETFKNSGSSLILNIKVTEGSGFATNCTVRIGNSSSTSEIEVSSGWCNGTASIPSDIGSDEVKLINVSITDLASQTSFNASYTIKLDNTAPTASLTLSASSITAGNSVSFTCSYSDTYSGVSNAELKVEKPNEIEVASSCPSTFTDTSLPGTYTVTYTVTDVAGNSIIKTSSFTVRLSSGGGGGTTTKTTPTFTLLIPEVAAGKAASIKLTKIKYDEIGVKEIIIKVSNKVNDIKISVSKLDNKPASVTGVSDKVYRYLEITKSNIQDSDISGGKIMFKVEKMWINENQIYPQTIALNRYVSGSWEKLNTMMTGEDDNFTYHEAETEGFSIFAITGSSEQPIIETTTTIQTTIPEDEITTTLPPVTQPTEKKTNYLPILLAMIFLIVGIVGYVLFKKK